jgi:rubrerythrin
MATSHISEDILQQGIQKEELSRSFYRELAENVSNPSVKEALLRMAEEEQRHKDLLVRRLRDDYAAEFSPREISGTEKYELGKEEITTHEHALVVLRTAMQLEDEAIDFYRQQLERVAAPEDTELLNTLVDFEQTHRKWLENEYKKMSTSSHWLP